MDLVCHGIGHDTPRFREARGNPASEFDSWRAFADERNTEYQGYTFETWNGERVGIIHWDLRHDGR